MLSNNTTIKARIFAQLIRRDLYILKPRLMSKLIDATIITLIQVLVFGSFLPLMGMPSILIGPTFIGAIVIMLFSLSHGIVLRSVFDLEYPRFIDYQITLPLGKSWVYAAHIVNFIIELGLTTLPLFTLGVVALGKNFVSVHFNIGGFIIIYLLSLLTFATLFIALSLRYPLRWIFDNMWPRRLTPIVMLSSISFVWADVYAFSPAVGILFLLNPFTYVAEGIRTTLIGEERFLPVSICILALIVTICLQCLLLRNSINKRLDPV